MWKRGPKAGISENHIRSLIRSRTGLSRFQETTYGLWVKGCYTDTQRGQASYRETIYTLLLPSKVRLIYIVYIV
jgi:hypothetical protein